MSDEAQGVIAYAVIGLLAAGIVVGGISGCMAIAPRYHVWTQEMHGKAKLAEARSSRQIQIQDAESKRLAATALAAAEVERAKGVAKANQIIGNSLKGNDDYLRYLWIDRLEQGANRETIYVPTEAGLPILEAGRRRE
jgi:hypothetical protein